MGTQIGICHRTRLLGECLQRVLSSQQSLDCKWLDASEAAQSAAAWFGAACELLLLDGELPAAELSGIVTQMRHHSPACKLLLLVSEDATHRMLELTQLGSQGCVRENGSLEELCTAIRLVLSGKSHFSPELANALIAQLNQSERRPDWSQYTDDARLTSREREVLRLIAAENLSNKQIARRLHVSLYTVKNHVHNIIEKLDVNDRHGAAHLARRRNLIWSGAAS